MEVKFIDYSTNSSVYNDEVEAAREAAYQEQVKLVEEKGDKR